MLEMWKEGVMSTSANVTVFIIRKDGKEVGRHSQHCYCNTNWEKLLQFKPLNDHTIQWTWYDEEEELHTKDPEPLTKFLARIAKVGEDLEKRFPLRKAKREEAGLPSPRRNVFGSLVIEKAAIRYKGKIYMGWRHDRIGLKMRADNVCPRPYPGGKAQGFVTNEGKFVSRKRARVIADAAGQGHFPRPGQAYSEFLWDMNGVPYYRDKPAM